VDTYEHTEQVTIPARAPLEGHRHIERPIGLGLRFRSTLGSALSRDLGQALGRDLGLALDGREGCSAWP
jgi:hypothetical protein